MLCLAILRISVYVLVKLLVAEVALGYLLDVLVDVLPVQSLVHELLSEDHLLLWVVLLQNLLDFLDLHVSRWTSAAPSGRCSARPRWD